MSATRRKLILAAIAVVVSGLLTVAVGAPSAQAQWAPGRSAKAPASRVSIPLTTVSVLGDSNTSASTKSLHGGLSKGSWVATALTRKYHATLHNGWARSGANSTDARANVRAWHSDVFVVMISTNDILFNHTPVPWAKTRSNIIASVASAGCRSVILSAIAPLAVTGKPEQSASELQQNVNLQALATERGWTFVDPWVSFRAADGTWLSSDDTPDGIHGTQATWATVGDIIGQAIDAIPSH